MIDNPMVDTAALPFVLGIALGLLREIAPRRGTSVVLAAWGAAVIYLAWTYFGLPSFPPVAASQKLVYLVYAGVVAGWLAGAHVRASLIDGTVGDISNSGTGAGMAGSITAALFLRRFVEKAKAHAHFDVYAWNPNARAHGPMGGEIQAARALFELLRERYPGR